MQHSLVSVDSLRQPSASFSAVPFEPMRETRAFYLPGIWSLIWLALALLLSVWQGYSGLTLQEPWRWAAAGLTLVSILGALRGLIVIAPGEAVVLTCLGRYIGTVAQAGWYWVHPLAERRRLSLRATTLVSDMLRVNDARGTPLEIAAMVLWQLDECARACFGVDDPQVFIEEQSKAALRSVAARYPYDRRDADLPEQKTLLSRDDELALEVQRELNERVSGAGLRISDVRITHLTYAPEIAHAMLRRQQANAALDARRTTVQGATELVKLALERLHSEGVIHLDASQRSSMVTSLMVALVTESDARPSMPLIGR